MIIGICGKSGCGKSTLGRAMAQNIPNAVHYDIDKIGHEVLTIKEVQNEAVKYFGEEIMSGGIINRKKLAELVFSSRERMNELSEITWKHMQIIIDSIIQDNQDKTIILDWILLSKTQYFNMCGLKILIDVPYEERRARAVARDNISFEEFDLREKASIEYDNCEFDLILDNSCLVEIRKLVNRL